MSFEWIVISSGHGLYVRGANGILDEVDEARTVVERIAEELITRGVHVDVFHDDVSNSQTENLNRIVDFHNSKTRDLDISVHFNAFEQRAQPVGTEVWYVTQKELADRLSAAIASVGFIDRGPKYTDDLFFLNNTSAPAVLLEICFVDSEADSHIYDEQFDQICVNIAAELTDEETATVPPAEVAAGILFHTIGKCSIFGGPDDDGVSPSEGLAFIQDLDQAQHLFLPNQPSGTTGLARRLNEFVPYLACRWDYQKTPKTALLQDVAWVRAKKTGIGMKAFPADWGPNENTGRIADLSPGLADALGVGTDDEVEVTFPYRG